MFEEDTSPSEPVDPVFTVVPPKMLKYKCMSTKTLELSRIFLKTKNSESAISSDNCEKADGQVNHNEKSEHEVLELIHKTVTPDANTDAVMKDILEQSTMEILNADEESDKNN